MKRFQPIADKMTLRRYVGSMSQLAGIKKYRMDDGPSRDVEAVDVRTGGGLEYTVLPGRGMDIAQLSYCGVPISYISKTGIRAAGYYESDGMNWLRGFYAGMLTTCGFGNVGGPCSEMHPVIGMRLYGLHGRLSYTPAEELAATARWRDSVYEMTVEGKLTESIVHGEFLTLRRRIVSALGEKKLNIVDEIENEGTQRQTMMLLYHMNVGYPLLDADARLIIAAAGAEGADETAKSEIEAYDRFHAPMPGRSERCYYHKMAADEGGKTYAAIVNDRLQLGVCFSFRPEQLPCLTEWKMLSEGEYVIGIEPGNTHPIGREAARRLGTLPVIEAGEVKHTEISIEVLDGGEEISEWEKRIVELRKKASKE